MTNGQFSFLFFTFALYSCSSLWLFFRSGSSFTLALRLLSTRFFLLISLRPREGKDRGFLSLGTLAVHTRRLLTRIVFGNPIPDLGN